MRVIIAGSRTINSYRTVLDAVDLFIDTYGPTYAPAPSNSGVRDTLISEVVCGTARGVDTLGKLWARRNHVPTHDFPAKWDLYGRHRAGKLRNEEMAVYANALIAVWDGSSPSGTEDMIERATGYGLLTTVVVVRRRIAGGRLEWITVA